MKKLQVHTHTDTHLNGALSSQMEEGRVSCSIIISNKAWDLLMGVDQWSWAKMVSTSLNTQQSVTDRQINSLQDDKLKRPYAVATVSRSVVTWLSFSPVPSFMASLLCLGQQY